FGSIEGDVGSLHQLSGPDWLSWSTSDPDADVNIGLQTTKVVRRLDRCANPIRQAGGIFHALSFDMNNRKFIATQASDCVRLFDANPEPVGNGHQQLIADQMSERVIHILEVVQ